MFWLLLDPNLFRYNSHGDSYQEIFNGFFKLLIREINYKGIGIRYTKCYSYYKKKVKRAHFAKGLVF